MRPDSSIPPETPTIPLEEFTGEDRHSQVRISDPATSLGGVVAGRYRLNAIIGEGGNGCVYEAVDMRRPSAGRDGEIVALKVLDRSFDETAGRFAGLQAQFNRWQRLLHPYIVRLFDCERDGSTVFITMEYVAGESMHSRLHREEPSSDRTPRAAEAENRRRIVGSVAQALAYAHQQGVVHGDLKPGNVLVNTQQDVKVIDFGITRWMSRPDGSRQERADLATPRYASPQVMAGEKPKPADDVYSLACFAYEVFTGVHPFEDQVNAPPRRRGMSSAEHRALVHALEPDAGARTSSIQQFTAELNSGASRGRWAAWPIGLAVAVVAMLGWLYHRSPAPAPPAMAPQAASPQAASPQAISASAVSPSAVRTPFEPGTSFRDCATCPSMTVLPAGQFRQGASDDDGDSLAFEKPAHPVSIRAPIALSTTDITVGEFSRFAAATGREMQGCVTYDGEWRLRRAASWRHPGFEQAASHPVTCVSWNDALAYAAWLSSTSGHRYRLPSASEWEYAARAGSEQVRPWRADAGSACASANVADQSAEQRFPGWAVFPCRDGYVYTSPAGSFAPNAFGLRDMLGNVFVWTQDCWVADYSGAPVDGSARNEPNCRERELRGGSWFSAPATVKATFRNHFAQVYRTSSVGFRLVREVP